MRITNLVTLILPILFVVGCSVSINNSWKVPDTDLEIAVSKQKPSSLKDEVERQMLLRDNHLDKASIKLAKGMNAYSRINIYQIGENEYILKDVFETYILNTQAKSLTKTSSGILTATFEDGNYPKFIGAFDDNESGNWRYIPASERKEIPLTKINEN
jgi:hypothetical protein